MKSFSLCQVDASGLRCSLCGQRMAIPTIRQMCLLGEQSETFIPQSDAKVYWNCAHLLGPTGDSIEQTECSCGEAKVSIFECGLDGMGDCAPFARGILVDSSIQKCIDCPYFLSR